MWAKCRHDGLPMSAATVLRLLREAGLQEIDDVPDLALHTERYRVDYNTGRRHEALSWHRPHDVHLGLADPGVPNFPEPEILPTA